MTDLINSRPYVVMISRAWNFDAGDPVILEGIFKLIPELKNNFDVRYSSKALVEGGMEALEKLIENALYVIIPGTPSWWDPEHRLSWNFCAKYKKRMTLIGVGSTVPYDGDFYYGREELNEMRMAGIIDLVICRDKFCYWWLTQKCGFSTTNTFVFPCPAFYTFDIKEVTSKKNVVMSIGFPSEVSHSSENTFRDYFTKTKYIAEELEKRGHTVHFTYQRTLPNYQGLKEYFAEKLPGRIINWFDTFEKFQAFHKDKDIYIGIRNHGALPCAGSGMPSLLLGTDNRQFLADEIPFLSRLDVSRALWQPYTVLDWHAAVYPQSISQSLRYWRAITYQRMRAALAPIIIGQLKVKTMEQEAKEKSEAAVAEAAAAQVRIREQLNQSDMNKNVDRMNNKKEGVSDKVDLDEAKEQK